MFLRKVNKIVEVEMNNLSLLNNDMINEIVS